jgi:hypothetical protein
LTRREFLNRGSLFIAGVAAANPLVKIFTSSAATQRAGAAGRGGADEPEVWLRGSPRRCSGWRRERDQEERV